MEEDLDLERHERNVDIKEIVDRIYTVYAWKNRLADNPKMHFGRTYENNEALKVAYERLEDAMKEIMTQAELEEYLNVSTNTVRKWRSQGLKIAKVGGINYYLADSVKEFIRLNEVCEYQRN